MNLLRSFTRRRSRVSKTIQLAPILKLCWIDQLTAEHLEINAGIEENSKIGWKTQLAWKCDTRRGQITFRREKIVEVWRVRCWAHSTSWILNHDNLFTMLRLGWGMSDQSRLLLTRWERESSSVFGAIASWITFFKGAFSFSSSAFSIKSCICNKTGRDIRSCLAQNHRHKKTILLPVNSFQSNV